MVDSTCHGKIKLKIAKKMAEVSSNAGIKTFEHIRVLKCTI